MEKKVEYNITGDGRVNRDYVSKTLKKSADEGSIFVSIKDADKNNEKFPLMEHNKRESLKLGVTPDELRKM